MSIESVVIGFIGGIIVGASVAILAVWYAEGIIKNNENWVTLEKMEATHE